MRYWMYCLLQISVYGLYAQTGVSAYQNEKHFSEIRQLTFQGDNAEAYWSHDDRKLVFQRAYKPEGLMCDQIFIGNAGPADQPFKWERLSTGKGRTTCSYFLPGDSLVVYASTHHVGDSCTPDAPRVKGKYYWSVHEGYELYIADLKGNIKNRLTNNDSYDAEAVVSPKGDRILFTSDRTGDLELWTMDLSGGNLKQITSSEGYDGGAFFSADGSQIIWRASRFDSDSERIEYRNDLKRHLVSPMKMELYIADSDGGNRRQLTRLGGANWAPYFHPSGKKVIFSSNHKTRSIPFNLYMINTDGTGLEQISFDPVFDSFPMFSHDGKRLVFCSNRNNGGTRDTNIFVVDWKD